MLYGGSGVFKTFINQGSLGIWLLRKAKQVLNCECWSWIMIAIAGHKGTQPIISETSCSALNLSSATVLLSGNCLLQFLYGIPKEKKNLNLNHFHLFTIPRWPYCIFKYIRFSFVTLFKKNAFKHMYTHKVLFWLALKRPYRYRAC